MKCFATVVVFLICLGSQSAAQTFEDYKRRAQTDFSDYKQRRRQEFKEYRDRVNAEFAAYMRRAWPGYEAKPALPVPERPEPPRPEVRKPDVKPADNLLRPGSITSPQTLPAGRPQPAYPLPLPEEGQEEPSSFSFLFYGTSCGLPLEERHRFVLRGMKEDDVADAWQRLSSDDYLPVVASCLSWRDRLCLCDWGYVRFVEQMTAAFFAGRRDEARLMQMYVLTQSGYKVRMARVGNRLVLLLPSKDEIYEYPYLAVGGERYYIVDPSVHGETFYLFDREYPKERQFSLHIQTEPLLAESFSEVRTFAARRHPELKTDITVNRNLMDFYEDYPRGNSMAVYAQASLSRHVKEQLYPVLRQSVSGKSQAEAANILIDFVQTAFSYQTDEEQFGEERPFFPDEMFFHPYSDCEDRAILYAVLVRDLLGLKTVLLHYPGHLAAAVRFDEEVTGDYMLIDGARYTVCDPTYIGADIGMAMPQYRHVAADVFRLE